MRTTSIVPVVLAAAAAASFPLSGTSSAYVAQGRPWPGGIVRYYNAATDQAWAVRRAVDAWNSSGARIRLIAAPASQASVRIEHFPRISCTINAEATIGYTRNARIWVFRRDNSSPYCNSYAAAESLAHEFGHVLGLGHETRGCSAMNPVGTLQGPERCPKAQRWQWRCRLLTTDDVAGAVALYGGSAAPLTGPRDCNLYAGMAAPTGLRVETTPVSHRFRISFRRPSPPAVPPFLSSEVKQPETFVFASSSSCATDPHRFPRRPWSAQAGGTESISVELPTGVSCVSVWSVDSFARPSGRAAFRIRVTETS
jgi:hypothetical protein